jgi:putative transposase
MPSPMTAEAVESVMRGFKKAVIERAVGAEMSHHLGYRPDTPGPITTSLKVGAGESAKTGQRALVSQTK